MERGEKGETSQRSGRRRAAINESGSRIPNGEAPGGGSLGRRGGDPGTGQAPVLSLATPEEEWRTGSAEYRSSSGTGWYVSHVGNGATCSTLAIWLGPCEKCGTGIIPLPNSQLWNSTPKMGRAGGSGPCRFGSPQSRRADGMGDHRRLGLTQPGAFV